MTPIPTSTTHIPANPTHARRPLLTPLPEPGHFLLVLDNSSAEKYTTCPESARNYLVLGREAHARSAALVFGGAIHAGLEAFLKMQYYWANCNPGSVSYLDRTSVESLHGATVQASAIVRYFTDNPLAISDDYRTVEAALDVLHHYRFYAGLPPQEWGILADANGPLIERAFELPLGVLEVDALIEMPWLKDSHPTIGPNFHVSHIHVAWSGRIDAIAHTHGLNRVVDHKTASDKRYVVPDDYHLAMQTIGYVWAAQQLWPHLNVNGFCLNAIVFKKPTGSGSIVDRGPRGGDQALTFDRFYFQYTPERLQWWVNNAMTIVEDFIHCLIRGYFPSYTKSCNGRYGRCQYKDVCDEDRKDLRDVLIQSSRFTDVTWNPVR